jgi:hypothetical protein
MASEVRRRPRDPHSFPGGEGRQITVRTNLFDMTFDRSRKIGMYEIHATEPNKKGNMVPVPARKLFSIFKKVYARDLERYEAVEGYPTEHGVTVYIVSAHRFDRFPPGILFYLFLILLNCNSFREIDP